MSPVAFDWQIVYSWVAIGLFAGVLSYVSCVLALSRAKKLGMIALPGERQSHQRATPTGGGLGLVLSIVMTTMMLELILSLPDFWWQKILPGVILLSIIGWRDDKAPVSSLLRLLVQLAVSIWLIGFGWWELSLTGAILFSAILIAVVGLMNVYNFMDGSNGMAGFQGVFAGVTMAILFQLNGESSIALIALIVAAACVGFLPLNFPTARVFMGDVSSVPLGFIFAALSVYGVHTGSLSLPLSILIMSVFLIDATLTLLSRAFRGEQWYTAHAQHIYQRLIAQGWSHQRVLVVYQAINVIWVMPAIVLAKIYPQYAMLLLGLTFLLLGTSWFIVNRRLGMIVEVQVK
jgi:Fuc2NAc and GlcNAc transferase